jgi:D-glycero-D-manno-heptose 1,7-bisphosphate phosphatase
LNRAIFLDRDGVLNQTIFRNGKPRAPYTLEDFKLFAGVPEATQLFKSVNFILIVVTNQPDVARGWVTEKAVHDVNNKLRELIVVDEIKICFHTEKDHCTCRKPRPGMLLEAAKDWNIDMAQSYMIGDRYSDVEAGQSAGCRTILIGEGDSPGVILPDYRHSSLLEAAHQILGLNR